MSQSLTIPCPCATCNWLVHPALTSAQDGLDPMQLVLVVFSWRQLVQRPYLHLKWASPATCAGIVYLVPTSAYTNVHTWLTATTHCNLHWWWFFLTNQSFTNVHTCTWTPFCNLHCVVVVVYGGVLCMVCGLCLHVSLYYIDMYFQRSCIHSIYTHCI